MVRIRPEWDETTRELALGFPDGTRVEGVVELGEPVAAVLYGRPHPSRRVIGPWESALAAHVGQPLTLLWSEEHATDRGARRRRRLARVERLARAPARGGRRRAIRSTGGASG